MRARRWLAAGAVGVLVLTALTALAGSPAAADPDAPSAGVPATAQPPALTRPAPAGAVSYLERGQRTSGGDCRFESEGRRHVDDGPVAILFMELSYDPASCLRRMARAEYDPEDLPPSIARRLAPAEDGQHRTERQGEPLAERPAATPDQTVIPFALQVQTWWEDLVTIDLSLTRSTVAWYYTYPDLQLWGPSFHESYWYWQDLSGWIRTSSNFLFYNDGLLAATNTVGHFQNPIFYLPVICEILPRITHANHDLTYGWAASGGFVGWNIHNTKSGSCALGMLRSDLVILA